VLASVLRQLIIGPTTIESGGGYTSALPKNLIILSASFRGEIGYIDLGSTLNKLPRGQEVLAVGQLVLTARDVGLTLGIQIKGVEITVAGVRRTHRFPTGAKPSRNDPGLPATLEQLGDCRGAKGRRGAPEVFES